MSYPGSYTPGPSGSLPQNAIVAATPGDQLAEALATGLRSQGWQVAVTDQVAAYAREARFVVVPVTPSSSSSPAVASAIGTPGATLIPLVVGSTSLPNANWASAPIQFTGDPQRAASDILAAYNGATSGGYGGAAPASQYGATAPTSQYGAPTSQYGAPAPGSQYGATAPTSQYGMPGPASQYGMPGPASQYGAPAPGSQYGVPGQPSQYGYPGYAAPAAPPKRGFPTWAWWVIGVVGVILIACIGLSVWGYTTILPKVDATLTATALQGEATATPVATATPNVPTGFKAYTDTADGFSIDYPQGWQQSSKSGELDFLSADTNSELSILTQSTTIPDSSIPDEESQFLKAIGGGSDSNQQGPTTVTYGGASWTQETADVSLASQQYTVSVLIANHGGKSYLIALLAPVNDYSTVNSQDFTPMLQTFTFLS